MRRIRFERLAPRVTFDESGIPNIEFLDLWQGDCTYREGVECNPEPDDGYLDTPCRRGRQLLLHAVLRPDRLTG